MGSDIILTHKEWSIPNHFIIKTYSWDFQLIVSRREYVMIADL